MWNRKICTDEGYGTYIVTGLFFADKIEVYKMTSDEVLDCPGYSDKQHRGNEGEGQFHLNESNIEYHRRNFLERVLTYVDLYNLLEG